MLWLLVSLAASADDLPTASLTEGAEPLPVPEGWPVALGDHQGCVVHEEALYCRRAARFSRFMARELPNGEACPPRSFASVHVQSFPGSEVTKAWCIDAREWRQGPALVRHGDGEWTAVCTATTRWSRSASRPQLA